MPSEWAAGGLTLWAEGRGGQGVGLLWASKGCRHSLQGVRSRRDRRDWPGAGAAHYCSATDQALPWGPPDPQVSSPEGMAHMREGPAHMSCKGETKRAFWESTAFFRKVENALPHLPDLLALLSLLTTYSPDPGHHK